VCTRRALIPVMCVTAVCASVAAAQPAQPVWEVAFAVPEDMRDQLFTITGIEDRLFVGGHGFIARYDGRAWTIDSVDPVAIFSFHGERADDVVALGSGATILRFDGTRWTREHQDRSLGSRATHDPELRRCGETQIVVLRDFGLSRGASGWSRVGLRDLCDPPRDERPQPTCRSADVRAHERYATCARDRTYEVWSETNRAWSSWPHRRRGRFPWRHAERGSHWFVATELRGFVFRRESTEWVREPLPIDDSVWGLWADERFVYAIVRGAVLRRPL
jgi:hypothetical protein